MDNNLVIETLRVCRICIEEIPNNTPFFDLDFTQGNTETTIGRKLSNCFPELDLSIIRNTIICGTCADIINFIYNFKNNCLRSELQIHKYIQQLQHTGDVDLAKVTQYYRNLNTEFKTENIEVTESFKHQGTSTLLCNDTAFNDGDDIGSSTNNEYLLSLQKVDSECVLFNTDDCFSSVLFNDSNTATEDNSNTYDNILQDRVTRMVDNRDSNIQDLSILGTTDICYQCYTCGHKSKSKAKLILHMKYHQQKITCGKPLKKCNTLFNRYRCFFCNYVTKYKCSLGFHIRRHLTKKVYKQILHRRHIKNKRSSITVNKINKDGKGKCSSRSYNKQVLKSRSDFLQKYLKPNHQFSQPNNLKPNMEAHMANKPLKCPVCEYRFNYRSHLKRHVQIHTGDKPFTCAVCEYQCRLKSDFKRHVQIHTGDKPFTCSICEYQCGRKSNLRQHMQIHSGEKPFTCSICEYQCGRKGNLRQHMQIHSGEKPFTCSVCEYRCKCKDSLKKHMLIHTGDKPFACSVCEYQSRQKWVLKQHMQIHTGDKPFTCAVCEYRCRLKSDLKRHVHIHTGEKPFTCCFCAYQCRKKSNLKKHMQVHTGDKPS